MPLAKIRYCLVADDVRVEQGGKATLLGFFGITPDVEIIFKNIERPVERMAFLFIGGESSGKTRLGFELIGPNGNTILKAPDVELETKREPSAKNTTLAISLPQGLKLSTPGKFTVRLFADGNLHYETSFAVRPASQEEVRRLGWATSE